MAGTGSYRKTNECNDKKGVLLLEFYLGEHVGADGRSLLQQNKPMQGLSFQAR